jgi:hypothetical protein
MIVHRIDQTILVYKVTCQLQADIFITAKETVLQHKLP